MTTSCQVRTRSIPIDSETPVDLTFASKAYDDNALLSYDYAFEAAHKRRSAPAFQGSRLISFPTLRVARHGGWWGQNRRSSTPMLRECLRGTSLRFLKV
ncbi:hypothetical protein BJX64DRAFT_252602 [Aspergillus heterothallicus]